MLPNEASVRQCLSLGGRRRKAKSLTETNKAQEGTLRVSPDSNAKLRNDESTTPAERTIFLDADEGTKWMRKVLLTGRREGKNRTLKEDE